MGEVIEQVIFLKVLGTRLNAIIALNNFSFIGSEKIIINLRIIETLNIFEMKPKLNDMQSKFPLKFVI